MVRLISLIAVLCVLSAVAIAAPAVTLNGKPVEVSVTDINGKAFIDVVALMQLLGGQATYDAAAGQLTITRTRKPVLADFGTSQLAGDNGQIGQVYELRKSNPLHFRLNSAEHTVSQVRFGNAVFMPEAGEKLLVLHFSVQNPQNAEVTLRYDSLKFTVVDAMNVNHEAKANLGDELTQDELNIKLKPAQRIEAYTCVVVPAKGVIPKLMVLPAVADDGPILRYDLRDQVTPLPEPIADATDPTGATALEVVPAQPNAAYPLRFFDVSVLGYETVTTALDAAAPPNGSSYFVVKLSCKNKLPNDALLRFGTLTPTLVDADGLEMKLHGQLLAATTNSAFNQQVKPGEEMTVRVYFTIPTDGKLKAFRIKEAASRTYEYDVSQVTPAGGTPSAGDAAPGQDAGG